MRNWTLAILYAALAAGLSLWLTPSDTLGSDLLARTALLVAPFRLAVWFEERCGCRLSGLWS